MSAPGAAPPLLSVARALAQCVQPGRLARLAGVLNARVADTALVFENVGNPGNVSACLRTAEALGVQHVCVIERWGEAFAVDGGVDKGTAKWLTVHRFGRYEDCLRHLRQGGFAVHATDLGPGALPQGDAVAASLRAAPVVGAAETGTGGDGPALARRRRTRPRVALAFGNEHRGCSRALRAASDARVFLPQVGFVQSLNLSVAAAVGLHAYLHRTPDYATRWRRLLAPGGDLGGEHPEHPEAHHSTPAERLAAKKAALLARRQPPPRAPSDADIAALLADDYDDSSGGGGENGGGDDLVCEGLPTDEKVALLARFLMGDVVQADKVLARAGLRPPDY
jgi:tRNA (guanosine-2'-O-)-methyltransferase